MSYKNIKSRINSIDVISKAINAIKATTDMKLARIKVLIEKHKKIDVSPLINSLLNYMSQENIKLPRLDKQELGLVIFSDKGLCGGFNNQLNKSFAKVIFKHKKIIFIGKRSARYAKKYTGESKIIDGSSLEKDSIGKHEDALSYIVEEVLKNQGANIYFNSYKSILEQIPISTKTQSIIESIIPQRDSQLDLNLVSVESLNFQRLLRFCLSLLLRKSIRSMFLESRLSEESSRLVSMDSSIQNAKKLRTKLQVKMNRSRQADITNQMIEIISALSVE